MEVEIISRKENLLLERTEIRFRSKHPDEKTPKRSEIREKLAEIAGVSKVNVVIDDIKPNFGKTESIGYAKIYKKIDIAKGLERDYILKRNNLFEKKEEKKTEKEAKKEEGKKKLEGEEVKEKKSEEKVKPKKEEIEKKGKEKKEVKEEKKTEEKTERKTEEKTNEKKKEDVKTGKKGKK